jgi:shikimate kinase
MATGKTTVGRIVAGKLGRRFVDLDRVIEETAGMTVADIFRKQGEAAFRQYEAAALRRCLEHGEPGSVIAAGGGAACQEDNLELMLARGRVVALSATPAEILKRGGKGKGLEGHPGEPVRRFGERPLLDAAKDTGGVQALLAVREPFYARAHMRVDTVGRTPAEVAAEIVAALSQDQ